MPNISPIKSFFVLSLLVFCLPASGLFAKDAKMKAEDVVAKHLASIGTAEARAAIKNRVVGGSAQAIFRLGSTGQLLGKSNVISDGRKIRLAMSFSALDYPGDQIAFDGEKITAGQIQPGRRSNLSAFIYTYDVILKEGFLTGTLSTAWPLLDLSSRQAKLDYTGLKKIDGKQLHEVKYRAKKGSGDLQVSLYFDAESFRHVRTQYRLVMPANMAGRPEDSSSQRDTIYTLVERFDDFKEVDGLTLPYTYKTSFTVEGGRATLMQEWDIAATQIVHNQQIDQRYFSVQ
jgi:hypothetical protein